MGCRCCASWFQSTRPRGARLILKGLFNTLIRFNPRAREGRDWGWQVKDINGVVSIHAPARGATPFQPLDDLPLPVSIHAPARGATLDCLRADIEDRVSIHAPARGATQPPTCQGCRWRSFNPRAREGRDLRFLRHRLEKLVSIHAPARGATHAAGSPCRGMARFNPRAREGRDAE